jgi:nitrite reductase/ring-hydroxylating ferredoxin subunit
MPAPPRAPKPSMTAEDLQTFPVRVEDGQIFVALPK